LARRPRRLRPGLNEPLLPATAIEAPEGASRLLLALHGYEDDPSALTVLLAPLAAARNWAVVAPTGPVRARHGAAWFTSLEGDAGPSFATTLDATEALAADACTERRLEPGRDLIVLGWSQGAAAALALALRVGAAVRPAIVIALAPWLPNEPDIAWDFGTAAASGLRALLVHGRDDEVVAVERGRSTHRVLERSGVDVTWIELDAGHDLAALLAAVPGWLES
jgi:predicted esterase